MRITVRFFDILRDIVRRDGIELELHDGATVGDACAIVARDEPELARWLPRVAPAVNREYVSRDHVLHDADELALIPPVSGG